MLTTSSLIAALPARDVERAKAWYADHLDLKPVREGLQGEAYFATGESRFFVYESEFAGTNQATAAAFEVSDVAATVQSLRARGVVFEEYNMPGVETIDGVVTTDDGTQAAWFKDSEGNIIGVFHES